MTIVMPAYERNISLTVIYKGENYSIQTYPNEYCSLMTLISDHLAIAGFGLCCGMGSCGTCLVTIGNKYTATSRLSLACDIQINDELSNTQIIISDQRY
jgi:aerobic-type carbon monoxide dehydrogenase small subunit (CoxS/CutS family)